jgi:hypothetical protein
MATLFVFEPDGTFSYEYPEHPDSNKSSTYNLSEGQLEIKYTEDSEALSDRFHPQIQ